MSDLAQPPPEAGQQSGVRQVGGASNAGPRPLGRRAFIAGVAGVAGAASVVSRAAAVAPGASFYTPVGPVRLADTRTYAPYTSAYKVSWYRISDRIIRIQVAGANGIPKEANAAVISIAVIGNGQPGWVRATPAGQDSYVANVLLDTADPVVTNLATVKLSASGYIDIKGMNPNDVIIDISGYYTPTATKVRGGRLQLLPNVYRVAAGTPIGHYQTLTVAVPQVPTSAIAVVVNLTAHQTQAPGYVVAYPTGSAVPDAANVNFGPGETRAAGAIVRLGQTKGVPAFDVFVIGGGKFYADVSGYITGPGDQEKEEGLFVPVEPVRLLDTRRRSDVALAGGKRRLWAGWTRPFKIPNGVLGFPRAVGGVVPVAGVAMNVTSTASMGPGFVTVLPAQTRRREVSNLNISRVGQTVSNHVISQASTAGIECYSISGSHIVCDVAGWYVGSPRTATQGAPIDPDPPAAPLNWALNVPDMGLVNWVEADVFGGRSVVDRGESWHWTDTGLVGAVGASIVAFGHRTSAGGPYRYQHVLRPNGSLMYVYTADERVYTYRYVGYRITNASAWNILNAARATPGSTFSLVSCTGTRTQPTIQPSGSVVFRLISTFVLESWADTSPIID
jgi:hypothetical protein